MCNIMLGSDRSSETNKGVEKHMGRWSWKVSLRKYHLREPYRGIGDRGRMQTNHAKKGKGVWCPRERPKVGMKLAFLINSLLMGSDVVSEGKKKFKDTFLISATGTMESPVRRR